MLTALLSFYRRHRRRILITLGLAASLYIAAKVFLAQRSRYLEAQQAVVRQKIKKKYQQTQQDCTYTILALLPTLLSALYRMVPVENTTKQLMAQKKTADSATKAELWTELKTKSLARSLAVIYSSALLSILIRLQLNIIARKDYLESLMQAAKVTPVLADADTYLAEQHYLSLSWWLLNLGYARIYEKCEEAVQLVFDLVSVKTDLTINELSARIAKTQELIDKHFLEGLLLSQAIFPPEELEAFVLAKASEVEESQMVQITEDPLFRVLADETRDYVSTDAVSVVLVAMVTCGIERFINNSLHGLVEADAEDLELVTRRFKLAKMLSVMMKEGARLVESSNSNEYVRAMGAVEELEEYVACVYSNFAI